MELPPFPKEKAGNSDALFLVNRRTERSFIMLLHIPHASTFIPEDEKAQYSQSVLKDQLEKMTDWGAGQIFNVGQRIEFPYSRLLCDVERFADGDEMEKVGMGVCYTRTSDGRILRRVSAARRAEIMTKYYWPHHIKLENAVTDELHKYGRCLIIDCHSFPGVPLPYERDQLRPNFCIGFDRRCQVTGEAVASRLRNLGYTVGINRPFAGALMPIRYLDDDRVQSVMIEANRDLVGEPRVVQQMDGVLAGVEAEFYM